MHTNVFYYDTWQDVLATKVNRRVYRADLLFEHVHWVTGKTIKDDIAKEAGEKAKGDGKIWKSLRQSEVMQKDFDKLRSLLSA